MGLLLGKDLRDGPVALLGMRPVVGLRAAVPQHWEGQRSEPP